MRVPREATVLMLFLLSIAAYDAAAVSTTVSGSANWVPAVDEVVWDGIAGAYPGDGIMAVGAGEDIDITSGAEITVDSAITSTGGDTLRVLNGASLSMLTGGSVSGFDHWVHVLAGGDVLIDGGDLASQGTQPVNVQGLLELRSGSLTPAGDLLVPDNGTIQISGGSLSVGSDIKLGANTDSNETATLCITGALASIEAGNVKLTYAVGAGTRQVEVNFDSSGASRIDARGNVLLDATVGSDVLDVQLNGYQGTAQNPHVLFRSDADGNGTGIIRGAFETVTVFDGTQELTPASAFHTIQQGEYWLEYQSGVGGEVILYVQTEPVIPPESVVFDAATIGAAGELGSRTETVTGTDGTEITLRASGPAGAASKLFAGTLTGNPESGENIPSVGIADEAVKGGLANTIIDATRNEVLTVSFSTNVSLSSITFAGISRDDDQLAIHGFTTDPGSILYWTLGDELVSGITSSYDARGRRLEVNLNNIVLEGGGTEVAGLVMHFSEPPSLDFFSFSADHAGAELATSAGVGISAVEYEPNAPGPLEVSIDTSMVQWDVSEVLVGMNQVYCFTPDSVFADGTLADWARRAGIGSSRFPGGSVVRRWDWQNPTGTLDDDPWDPSWDTNNNVAASEWMSLDEYLDFIDASGITPHFGVNLYSGYLWDREADGIARTVAMVEYVKARGHGGALWYMGNEEAARHGDGYIGYFETVARYAAAMKAADPDLQVLWTKNELTTGIIRIGLENDAGLTDGLETHGKWPYGGDPGEFGKGRFDEWQEEVPLRDRRNFRAWRTVGDIYRNYAKSQGREAYLIANNEYGIGKEENQTGFTRYTYGLLVSELLMEHFIGDWDMCSFWDLTRDNQDYQVGLLDIRAAQAPYRLNPAFFGMNLLSDAQGGEYLQTISSRASAVHGFAARRNDSLIVYLINKRNQPHQMNLSIEGAEFTIAYARRLQASVDHEYGEIQLDTVSGQGSAFAVALPPLTLTEVVLTNTLRPENLSITARLEESMLLHWQSLPGKRYQIATSSNLNNWVVLPQESHSENFEIDSVVAPSLQTNACRFFRVQTVED
jgi:hypothetical protein